MHSPPTIIDAFHLLACLTPEEAHPTSVGTFTEGLTSAQRSPYPGVVPDGYHKGGVVFVARNGALGSSPEHQRQDEKTAQLWLSFAQGSGKRKRSAFKDLMHHLSRGMYSWNIIRYIDAFTKQAKIPCDSVALINMIAVRSQFRNIRNFSPIYEEAWRNYTSHIITALSPSFMVPLGNDQGKHLRRLYRGDAIVLPTIRRSIGDKFDPKTLGDDISCAVQLYSKISRNYT